METFYWQKEAGQRSCSRKEWIVSGKAIFLWGKAGVSRADYLASADQVVPD